MEIRKTIILISRINLSFKLSKYARELKTTKVAKACGFIAPKEHLERLSLYFNFYIYITSLILVIGF